MIYNTYSQNMYNLNGYSMMNGMNFLNGFGYGYGCGSESMMWMSLGNMLANCTMTAVSQGVAAKKEAQANSPEVQLKALEEKATKLESTKRDAESTLTDVTSKANEAINKYNENQKIIDSYDVASVTQTKTLYETWVATGKQKEYKGADKLPTKDDYNAALKKEKDYNDAVKKKSTLETEKNNAEKAKNDAQKAVDQASKDIKNVNDQIDELKAEIQQAKDMKLFNKADGNIFNKRTNKDDLYKTTFDSKTCPATEADMRGAILALRKAQKGGNADTIKKAAGKAKEVYEALPDVLKRQYSDAAAGIDRAL